MTQKKTAGKNQQSNFFARVGRGIVNIFLGIGKAFKGMWRELKKVTWPTRTKLINYAVIVLLFMLFMMIVIGLLDTGASQVVNLIMTNFG